MSDLVERLHFAAHVCELCPVEQSMVAAETCHEAAAAYAALDAKDAELQQLRVENTNLRQGTLIERHDELQAENERLRSHYQTLRSQWSAKMFQESERCRELGEARAEIERLQTGVVSLRQQYDSIVKMKDERDAENERLREVVRELANSGVEHDTRKYLVVQIDHETMRLAKELTK